MTYYILKIAGIIAIFQMLLLIFFFNNKKNRNSSNIILSFILLVYTMQVCAIVFMSSFQMGTLVKYNLFPAFFNQFALLFGPFVWLYSKSLIGKKIYKWELLHGLPFAIIILFMIAKKLIDPNYLFWFSSFRFYTSGLILIQSLIYLMVTGFSIVKKKGEYKAYLNKSLNFQIVYGFLLVGFILLWVLKFNTFLFLDIWKRFGVCPITTSSYFVTGFLFFNVLVYIALIKPEIFILKKKYQNINLTPTKKQTITKKLQYLMEDEKIYADSSLNLTLLATKLEIPVPYLSQIINEEYSMSFPGYVNAIRIKEAKRLLLNDKTEYTIQQIMFEVGFNSKSAFNNAFKKNTGCTPSELKLSICK
jgi:AraC-like DNA-binding protein